MKKVDIVFIASMAVILIWAFWMTFKTIMGV